MLTALSPNLEDRAWTVPVEFANDLTCPPDVDASFDAGTEAALDGG